MKDRIKKNIIGTPFEGFARRTFKLIENRFLEDPENARYNRETVAVMRRVLDRDSNCVDVGSSIGDILRDMVRFAPEGLHYAFEPTPSNFERLTESFPGVSVYDVALSDTKGKTTFHHVVSNSGYSGLKRREYPDESQIVEEIMVETDLLDNIVPEDTPIRFIKVDVEGAELQVFRGARDTIRRNKPVIVFEHQLGAADYYGTTPEEVYDLLVSECGLQISLMRNWLKNTSQLSREEFSEQFYRELNFYFLAHP